MKLQILRCLLALAFAIGGPSIQLALAAQLYFISESDGGILGIGSDVGCGTSISETLESAFDGFSVRNGTYPAVGEVWYAHVYVSHPGNPCNGGNYNGIQIALPASTAFAISADYPVFCALYSPVDTFTKVYYRQDQGCPQAPSAGDVGYYFWAYDGLTAQPWLIVSYAVLELLIPLRSSAPINGQSLGFRIKPDVALAGDVSVGVYVDGDIIFRDDAEGITLYPELCGVSSCYVQP